MCFLKPYSNKCFALRDCFIDELLIEKTSREIVFMSIYGNEVFLQHIRGSLSLPKGHEKLLTRMEVTVHGSNLGECFFNDGITQIAKIENDRFVSLSHMLYYHPLVERPAPGEKHQYLVSYPGESELEIRSRQWSIVNNLADVPLYQDWSDELLPHLYDEGVIKPLINMNEQGSIKGYEVSLQDDFDQFVSEMVLHGHIWVA